MKTHIQIVAALHLALGVMSLIAAAILFVIFGLVGGFAMSQGQQPAAGIVGIAGLVLCGFLTVLGLPGIIGGWALLARRSWGLPVVLVLGALDLLNLPFGTLLGIYTLWALTREAQTPMV